MKVVTSFRTRKSSIYDKKSNSPFKISRSKFFNFLTCKRCFYLDRVKGLKEPSSPPYTLNNTVDELLKKEFDKLRISYLESYTNFITINLGNKANLIYKKLLINGIILRPLDNYEMKNYLRVTVGTPKENAYIITKLKSIRGLKHNV